MKTIYLIGSLRNPNVRELANQLRELSFDVFDDWHSAGPQADDIWQEYEQQRGHSYLQALQNLPAQHAFGFDLKHLQRADIGVMLMPTGKSCHLELGYMLGQGKLGYVLFDKEPERWDLMYRFATGLFMDRASLFAELKSIA